ncbi:hypothetical protein Poly51_57910 [Rubripirellula tenax]|uniref:Uncharacterized protein n=1 Tax=Rubripirellula tenax TaxID=2528015 RepID=A0A5C6E712_9BACT|nr:hypothetical protein [Rubripirellula tenax]TWU44742.1 hypothetical protein Poly51_57910 [Rubripirellula tenax]
MKKYEILKHKWVYEFSHVLKRRREKSHENAYAPTVNHRSSAIQDKIVLVTLHHLQIGVVDDLPKQAQTGVDLVVDYFCGDWWTKAALARLTEEQKTKYKLLDPQSLENCHLNNKTAVDRSKPSHSLRWYTELRCGLLLGGLTGRWDDVAKICAGFDATIPPEYCAGEIEDQMFQIMICIAGSLSPEPMDGADQLFEEAKKSRLKRPRLLCAAWEAVIAKDQAAFDKAFVDSVKHFVAKPVNSNISYDIVALAQSIIWLIAEHRGLTLPEMSEKCLAAVLTRQSVGLA